MQHEKHKWAASKEDLASCSAYQIKNTQMLNSVSICNEKSKNAWSPETQFIGTNLLDKDFTYRAVLQGN